MLIVLAFALVFLILLAVCWRIDRLAERLRALEREWQRLREPPRAAHDRLRIFPRGP